jgi:hypothetical protein
MTKGPTRPFRGGACVAFVVPFHEHAAVVALDLRIA